MQGTRIDGHRSVGNTRSDAEAKEDKAGYACNNFGRTLALDSVLPIALLKRADNSSTDQPHAMLYALCSF